MSFFVDILLVGLGGLLLMALPGVRRHGRAGHARAARGRAGPARGGHLVRHAAARSAGRVVGRAAARGAGRGHPGAGARAGGHAHALPRAPHVEPMSFADSVLYYLPEPRMMFTVIALFGAFGNVFAHLTHASFALQLGGAALSAALVEWLVVARVWRLALRFTGEPSSPLETLLMQRVRAVTPFKNGKGIVQVERDGRALQLAAELLADEKTERVRVGDPLTVEDVDVEHERVVVSTR